MPPIAIGGFAIVAVGWLSNRINDRTALVLISTLPVLINNYDDDDIELRKQRHARAFTALSESLRSYYALNVSNSGEHKKKGTVNAFLCSHSSSFQLLERVFSG